MAAALGVPVTWLLKGGEVPRPAAKAGRVLEFPRDHSLGTLLHMNAGPLVGGPPLSGNSPAPLGSKPLAWAYLGEATGRVQLQKGWYVKLVAAPDIQFHLDELVKMTQREHFLHTLFLDNTGITDRHADELEKLEGVQDLSLASTDITKAGLRFLKKLPHLRSLDLTSVQLTDTGANSGLGGLADLESLKSLNLSDTCVEGGGLGSLRCLSILQRLFLRRTPVKDRELQVLAKAQTVLDVLDLTSTEIGREPMAFLSALGSLTTLVLERTQITDESLRFIGQLKNLRELDLTSCTNITGAGLAHLANLTRLERLQLHFTRIGDEGAANLRNLSGLKWLGLRSAGVTDKALEFISGLTDLETLLLQETRVGGEQAMASLSKLKKLNFLALWGSDVTDKALKCIARLEALQSLGIGGTLVTDAGLEELGHLPFLRMCSLAPSPNVGDVGVLRFVRKAKALQELDLGHTGVSDVGLQRIMLERPDVYLNPLL